MELNQIKDILFQTECGSFLCDGMGCSEPLPVPTKDGVLDNFFLYMYNSDTNSFSAPVARIGMLTERKQIVYFYSCYDEPFSVKPQEVMSGQSTKAERADHYAEFKKLYNQVRPLFYSDCSECKELLVDFLNAFKEYVDLVLWKFYIEMLPPFFEWLYLQTGINELEGNKDGEVCD